MKDFLLKMLFLVGITYIIIVGVNYIVDPAYIFHTGIIDDAVETLTNGEIIYSPGDFDEGLFDEKMISSLKETPDTVIIGSSHVMYVPWEFDNYFVAGLSGACFGDYYALIGLLEKNDKLPRRIVLGIDPYAFMTSYDNGGHTSLKKYALYEYARINDKDTDEHVSDSSYMLKYKEIASFSYFQSSIRNIRAKGIKRYIEPSSKSIKIALGERVETVEKIMPNCSRIMGNDNFATVEQNTAIAEQIIQDGSISGFGGELLDVDRVNFADFEILVKYLIDQGVTVEFYLPSWYPVVYDFFEHSDRYAGVIKVEDKIRGLGKAMDITVHGSYNPRLCGVVEGYFADWQHLKAEFALENYNTIIE